MPSKNYDVIIERGHSEINDRIIDFLKTKIKGNFLDVGCNTGWLVKELSGFGIDASPEMVKIANDPRIILGKAEKLPFRDKEFDTVVLSCVLEQCDRPQDALKEARRVGKRVIGINPYPGSRWGKIGGWVKSIISPEEFNYTEKIDDERYYFEDLCHNAKLHSNR
jgi:SAM-dependent methyltransferase